jgi:hypothetical protein
MTAVVNLQLEDFQALASAVNALVEGNGPIGNHALELRLSLRRL